MNDLRLRCGLTLRGDVCFKRSHYTGKERDAESGNDYFGARLLRKYDGAVLEPRSIAALLC